MLYEKMTMTSSNNKEVDCSSNLEKKADLFKAIVNIKDRRYHFKTYKECFVGREAVDTMVDSGWADTREEAVEIAQELEREMKLFVHVCGDHTFKDDYLFYRFNSVQGEGEEEEECTPSKTKKSKKKKNKKKKKTKKPSIIELRRLMEEAKDLMSLDTDMSEAMSRGSQLALSAQFDCTSPTSVTTSSSGYGRGGDVVATSSSKPTSTSTTTSTFQDCNHSVFDASTILSNSEVEPIIKCFGSYRFNEHQAKKHDNEGSSCFRRQNMIDTTIGFRRRKSSSTTSGCGGSSGCDLPPMTPSRQRSNSVKISEVIDMAIRTVDGGNTTTPLRRHHQQRAQAVPPPPPPLPLLPQGSLSKLCADSPPTMARRWKSPTRTRQRNGRE